MVIIMKVQKENTMNKIIKRILIGLLTLVLVLVVAIGLLFQKEIATVMSVKQIDDYGLYEVHVSSDYAIDELVAQGGANNDSELVNFVIGKVLKGLPIELNIPDFGCSTFQVQNEAQDWIFGRNYDLDPVPGLVVFTEPENGYKSISIANANVLGLEVNTGELSLMEKVLTLASPYILMDGMNEMGLSIGVLLIKDEATNQVTDKPDMTTTSMLRLVLDKAATVEEAIALFEAYDMHASSNASYHFQVVDAQGNSAVIEYVGNEISVIRKEEGEHQYLTNFLITPEVYGFGKGHDRFEILQNTIEEKEGVMSEQEAMDLLEAVSQDGEDSSTQWSAVYNNTQKTVSITVNGQFDQVYTYSLD